MIKNERQYRITRAQAEKFLRALRKIRADADDRYAHHPRLRQLQEDALRSQLSDLEAELREYEDLKEGRFAFEKLEGISELPKLLIRARIASGLTQRDLAGRLELKEQQIQRYEASEYASASFTRIKEVVSALGIEVDDNLSVDDGIDDWPQ
jgi:ribosome-binding protein aMBF1 (putative translation factor)